MMYSIEFLDTVNIYRLCVRKEFGGRLGGQQIIPNKSTLDFEIDAF